MTVWCLDAAPHGSTEIAMSGIADHVPKFTVSLTETRCKTPMGKCFSAEKTGGRKGVTMRLSKEWHTARERAFTLCSHFPQLQRIQLQRQPSLHDSTMHQLFLSLFPHFSFPNLHKHQTLISYQVHNYQHQKTQTGNLPVALTVLRNGRVLKNEIWIYVWEFFTCLKSWHSEILKKYQ